MKHKENLRVLSEMLELKTILTSEKIEISQLGDRYTELTIISPLRQWKLVEHELLSRGKEHEECREQHLQRELEKIRIDQLFRSSFTGEMRLMERSTSDAVVLNTGCSAVACGVPGIGKTTLVQKIIHDWATGTIYPYFQFVFSFKFRDLNSIRSKVTLKDLILNSYPYLATLLEELWKNPTVLLFIFDGFDEFNGFIDFADRGAVTEPKHMCLDPEWPCEVSDIVYSLIQRKLLPGCSVLLTTRPASLNLLEQADINVWVEILGFVGEQRKEYFNRFFGDRAVAEAVFKHVKENEILYTMSYNPSYCCILGLTLGPFFMHKGRDLKLIPKTITQLYSYYVYNILKKHSSETKNVCDVLLRVGQMAFIGVSEKKIVFQNEDLMKHNLQPSQVLSGFLVELRETVTTGSRVVYTFPHLTIQEFVAALALFLCPYPGDIKKLLTEAHSAKDGRFEVSFRFVAGLSSPGSSKPLMEFVDQFPEESIHQVIDWVKQNVDNQIGSSWSERGKRNLLNTLHYLFESQNPAVAQVTLGSVPRLTFGDADAKKALSLTPIDCAVLSHAIGLCCTINELDLRNCCIQYEGMLRLEALRNSLLFFVKAKELDLRHNKLGDRGMKRLTTALNDSDCQIQELRVEDNGLTDSCAEDLAAALCATPSLTKLNLGENYLGDSGVKVLSRALMDSDCKIQKLSLNNNQLTDSSARDIASTLNANISLTQLDLGENTLGDSGVKMLSVALRDSDCNIQELGLSSNHLTASFAHALASALSSLTELSVGDNKLGDAGVRVLSEALKDTECNIQELRLNNNGLTQSCAEDLAAAINTNDSLTGLDLSDNKLGDSGIKALNAALVNPECKIEKLGLGRIVLTDSVFEDFISTLGAARVMKDVSLETNLSSDLSGPSFGTSNEQKSGMDAMGVSSDL
ncbi:NACHT, LRR and PYD domains-containing protein 3-like [Amblyraja radiata]|uniref:NACHT, LRR and PYD domains-containing protein 3-like n=1 Tax=Amblyraja radiata TaxID=386614 RepID=UPI0014022310|nr:NACHT, LRR and PYD domains-containing protein 3-like [Amblyraja radiata]